ncbi:AAA family ATPase [Paraliobacillus sp. JSM ZJ581]|uniref:AAA family ATPase n=1 Tax=Paraliobacillus sp. JSM ZJ581 TaxID=3342118 RepID=UPI0035A831F4
MRAMTLELAAFGPYKDKQIIDFRSLGNETIFLVTGPTGAGKTSIFDAICFSLYGKASGSDRDQDGFRSQFAASDEITYVSFTFELRGKQYLVHRKPKQPRKKERGEGFREDPTQAELYKVINGKKELMYSKVKDVNETIESLLGLDYDQFRKMIMIPQGEFRKLIAENSKAREEILQKIFHTYFYQEITEELKKQTKEKEKILEQLEWKMEQELQTIDWLDFQDKVNIKQIIDTLDNQLTLNKEKEQELTKQQKDAEATLQAKQQEYWQGVELANKFKQQQELMQEQYNLEQQKDTIIQKQGHLKWAEKAKQIELAENQYNERAEEAVDQKEKVNNQKNSMLNEQQQLENIAKKEKLYCENLEQKEKELQLVTEQKQKLTKLKSYQAIKQELTAVNKELTQLNQSLLIKKQSKADKQQRLDEVDQTSNEESYWTKQYYEEQQINENARNMYQKSLEFSREFEALKKLRQHFLKINEQYNQYASQVNELRSSLKEIEENQKQAHAVALAEQLKNGDPCPVCGSQHHPNVATHDKPTYSSKAYEQQKQALIQVEEQQMSFNNKYVQAKADGEAKRQVVDNLAKELTISVNDVEERMIQDVITHWKNKVEASNQELQQISKQLNKISTLKSERKQLQENISVLDQAIEKIEQQVQDQYKTIWTYESQLQQLKEEMPEEAFTVNNWEENLLRQEQTLIQWFDEWEKIEKKKSEQKTKVDQAKTTLTSHESFYTELKHKKEKALKTFQDHLIANGFTDESEYRKAKLTEHQMEVLSNEIDLFNQYEIKVKEQLAFLSNQLHDKHTPNIEALKESVKEEEEQLEKHRVELQQLKSKMSRLAEVTTSINHLQHQKEEEETAFADVSALASLAQGQNHLRLSFERYVLASFLDEILLQANIRLDQLTEHRYQLLRSNQVAKKGAQSGLDLEVLDQYTGQQRSVKTLSGGEGFKTSLSLALGMADVVQAHAGGVQLETLFIDEGFGTLDDLSLAQAIECLKGLQQSNRMLGIISHVPQLKEEIYAQLQIIPSSNGSHASFTFKK